MCGSLAGRAGDLGVAGSGLSVDLCLALARLGQGSFSNFRRRLAVVSASQHPLSLIISRGLFNDPDSSQVILHQLRFRRQQDRQWSQSPSSAESEKGMTTGTEPISAPRIGGVLQTDSSVLDDQRGAPRSKRAAPWEEGRGTRDEGRQHGKSLPYILPSCHSHCPRRRRERPMSVLFLSSFLSSFFWHCPLPCRGRWGPVVVVDTDLTKESPRNVPGLDATDTLPRPPCRWPGERDRGHDGYVPPCRPSMVDNPAATIRLRPPFSFSLASLPSALLRSMAPKKPGKLPGRFLYPRLQAHVHAPKNMGSLPRRCRRGWVSPIPLYRPLLSQV